MQPRYHHCNDDSFFAGSSYLLPPLGLPPSPGWVVGFGRRIARVVVGFREVSCGGIVLGLC